MYVSKRCTAPLLPEKDSKEFQLHGVQSCTVACMSYLKKVKQQVKSKEILQHVEGSSVLSTLKEVKILTRIVVKKGSLLSERQ